MIGIVILNWNGWEYTIDCLKSLTEVRGEEFFIVLVDNGSTDDSVEILESYLKSSYSYPSYIFDDAEFYANNLESKNISNKTVLFYKLDDNCGFAKGNNIGLKIAKFYSPDYYMLLNNDTEVEPDFLSQLVLFIKRNPQYSILTPKICYYFDKDIIWNCGGKLWWGFRKYYYAGCNQNSIRESDHIKIGYITGCALFFKAEIIVDSPLLTERFFHGEEDFEFSYRMKRSGIKIACVLNSKIYHKVGMATKSLYKPGKTFVYYLNRFINMRTQMPCYSFFLWKCVYVPYIALLLKKRGYSLHMILYFIKKLLIDTKQLDGVSKEKFFELLNGNL